MPQLRYAGAVDGPQISVIKIFNLFNTARGLIRIAAIPSPIWYALPYLPSRYAGIASYYGKGWQLFVVGRFDRLNGRGCGVFVSLLKDGREWLRGEKHGNASLRCGNWALG